MRGETEAMAWVRGSWPAWCKGRGYYLATRATGPPGAGGSTIVTSPPSPRAGETEVMAWLREPLARLVQRARGITWLRGPLARLVQRVRGITWGRGPLARLVQRARGITWVRGPPARLVRNAY